MINAEELLKIATEYNYERILYEKARIGHTETRLYFATEDLAYKAKEELFSKNFTCSKIDIHYTREGADYSFVAKWV